MEVKIGVQHSPRELVVDTDQAREDVEAAVAAAVSGEAVLSLTDTKGRTVIVPAAKIAYVEIGGGVAGTVGFRS